jgi:hypothetical protein
MNARRPTAAKGVPPRERSPYRDGAAVTSLIGIAVEFRDYLGARLAIPATQEIPALAEILNARGPGPA